MPLRGRGRGRERHTLIKIMHRTLRCKNHTLLVQKNGEKTMQEIKSLGVKRRDV